jgi:hypothetical protein
MAPGTGKKGSPMMTMNFCDLTTRQGICEGEHPQGGDCEEPLEYPWKKCPVCDTDIAWTNYPESARDKMRFTPKEQLGKDLLEFISQTARVKVVHFKDIHTLRRWNKIIGIVPEVQVRKTWEKCAKKRRGRGLLDYIFNALDYIIDHDQVEQVPEQHDPDAPYDPGEVVIHDDAEYIP